MPYYEIPETQFYQLKDAIKKGKIVGVGALSHFLNIYINKTWEIEDVVIANMYFPEDEYCIFDFPRKRVFITDETSYKARFDIPGRRTHQERQASRRQN